MTQMYSLLCIKIEPEDCTIVLFYEVYGTKVLIITILLLKADNKIATVKIKIKNY